MSLNTGPSMLLNLIDENWRPIEHGIQAMGHPGFAWNELILSWNVEGTDATPIRLDVSLDGETWYRMASWAPSKGDSRTSVKGQKDAIAHVDTDTLIASKPQNEFRIRITWPKERPRIKSIVACLANRSLAKEPIGDHSVWGKVLEPPKRAQMSYPNGGVLCSPTSTSMLLGYWASLLNRPALDHDVPLVQEGVFDPGWNGTGNWPFNTAFAGALPGVRGYVTRLWGIGHLERWIARDVPVVCSVAYSLLQGKPKASGDGHLVVLVGFTADGDPVFNDPGRNVVRMTYKRADFEKAWAHSGRTVYLIYPKTWAPPENSEGAWVDSFARASL